MLTSEEYERRRQERRERAGAQIFWGLVGWLVVGLLFTLALRLCS